MAKEEKEKKSKREKLLEEFYQCVKQVDVLTNQLANTRARANQLSNLLEKELTK